MKDYLNIIHKQIIGDPYKCADCYHREREKRRKNCSLPKINCVECKHSVKDVGVFNGDIKKEKDYEGQPIIKHDDIYNFVPIEGKEKLKLMNVNQAQFEKVLSDATVGLKVLFICGSPRIFDFTMLERFNKLETLIVFWNNKAEKLWDLSKTPNLKYLWLSDFNKLSDYSQLQLGKEIRCLDISGERGKVDTISWLKELTQLESITITIDIKDKDILPIIQNRNISEVWLSPTIFDVESYAMLEVRRKDIKKNFRKGFFLSNNLALGKYYMKSDSFTDKQMEEYKLSYINMMKKYKTDTYIPILKKANQFPTQKWRENGIIDNLNTIQQIEEVIKEYSEQIIVAKTISTAKKIVKDCTIKLNSINEQTETIETEEREELYDFISSFFKDDWFEELEETLEDNRDW